MGFRRKKKQEQRDPWDGNADTSYDQDNREGQPDRDRFVSILDNTFVPVRGSPAEHMKYTSVGSFACSRCHSKPGLTANSMGDNSHYTMVKNRHHNQYHHNYSAVGHTHHYNDNHHHQFHNHHYHHHHHHNSGGGRTAIEIIAELGSESNAHGLAKIVTSRDTKRKVIWALLVIVGFTAATLQLSLLVRKYLQFQVVELSEIKDSMPVEYPSVTVCNIDPLSIRKVTLHKNDNTPLIRWLQFIQTYRFHHMSFFQSIRAFYENLGEQAKQLSHILSDMLIHCRFNREVCKVENFTSFFDGNYFNCFTFNGGQLRDQLQMHATGPENGLSLIISVEKFDPVPTVYGIYNFENNILHSAGIRVVVHAPGSMPSPVDHGFDIPPGYSSSVGLKAVLHTRLSEPYGNCTEKALEGIQTYRNTFFACLQLCKQRLIIKRCKCKSSALPEVQAENVTFCGSIVDWPNILANTTGQHNKGDYIPTPGLECEEREQKNLNNDRAYEADCGCYQPCSETTYLKSVSLSYWPLEFYQLNALEHVFNPNKTDVDKHFMKVAFDSLYEMAHPSQKKLAGNHSRRDPLNESTTQAQKEKAKRASDLIRQNMLRLNIYLEDLSVVEYRQLPAYGLADLFADIGGTMGLWMGISVLTIMELCELIIRLLGLLFNSEKELPSSLIHPTTTASTGGASGGGAGGCCCSSCCGGGGGHGGGGGGGCSKCSHYSGSQCCSNGHGPYSTSNGDVEHGAWDDGGGGGYSHQTSAGNTDIGPSAFDFRRGIESPV
ncbi:FMRFamide-gated na+ channel [Plakobranchus ocellatus]|uniref:FMRFamide-gated na+ channel n=1 Tax=Plakobranchus ocellatus TaxID=259542 RepID=A0AAV3YPY6_9GAST|nr:FMRFamide-gated na+ channel [Plakobranchus ocellatus]